METKIRVAKITDAINLAEIYNNEILNSTATFDTEEKPLLYFQEKLSSLIKKQRAVVYEQNGTPVGFAWLSDYNPKSAYKSTVELSLYVHKNYQGRKIGSVLMDKIITLAKNDTEIHSIISLITSDNTASIHLHKKFGFLDSGKLIECGCKFGKLLDVSFMQIIL